MINFEYAKKVITKDLNGNKNGHLIEIMKDGNLTTCYLTACAPGSFKGYHLHKIRSSNYVCVKGKMLIITYENGERREFLMTAEYPIRLHIPPNIATGLKNVGNEEGWLINYPDPPYDPDLKDEQVDFTEEELENGKR